MSCFDSDPRQPSAPVVEAVRTAVQGLSPSEVVQLLEGLAEVQKNLFATLARLDEIGG